MDSFVMMWTRWHNIELPCQHDGPATYKVRIVDPSGSPFTVPRFLKEDNGGILSIGQTGNMDARRRQFVRALGCGVGHSSGNLLYCLLSVTRLKKRFVDYRLEYQYSMQPDKESARFIETAIAKEYLSKYGEAPPLCSIIPGVRDYLKKL